MEMLQLKDKQDFDSLIPNKWKIREFQHSDDPSIISKERENGELSSFFLPFFLLPLKVLLSQK